MSRTLRVLIVEDSEDDSMLLVRKLRQAGYEPVFERVSAPESMNAALDKQAWDIVLADYVMPQFSGTEALELLKKRRMDIPFIVVTGKISEETAVEIMRAGAHDYIMKDNLSRLMPAIERELRETEIRRERRRAEEALRKEKDRVQKYLEIAGVFFVVIDTDQRVILVNKKGCEILGYEEKDITGKNWFDNFLPERYRAGVKDIAQRLPAGEIEPFEYFENPVLTRSGEEKIIAWHNTVLRDAAGNITAHLSSGEDITERKRLETQLMRLHKMEALSQLSRGIAHDFNNILAALTGYSNLLKMKMEKEGASSHNVDQILMLIERATGLTQNLLAFSRNKKIRPEPADLNNIVRKAGKLMQRIVGHNIKLKIKTTDESLAIMADNGQIEHSLINLAANARDAMPAGGILTVETKPVEMDSNFVKTPGYGKPGRYVLVSVADTGTGMNEETKKNIFDLFFTTKGSGKGTGLGLSIVHEIIKRHNGYIDVSSESGKGTVIKIYLPAIKHEAEETKHILPDSLTEGTETVLVAEDEAGVREDIKTVLEEFGYKVIEAVDGKDAIEKFRNNKDNVRLVLLDVVMPGKNGKEVYIEAKNINPDVKALLISGYAPDILHKRGISEEGLKLLTKPISPQNLLRQIREALLS